MKKSLVKIGGLLIIAESVFVLCEKIFLPLLQHNPLSWIYHVNINLLFLITFFFWINVFKSTINRLLVLVLSTTFTLHLILFLLKIFYVNFNYSYRYIIYTIAEMSSVLIFLSLSLFVFFISISPQKREFFNFKWAVIVSVIIGFFIFGPVIMNKKYLELYLPFLNLNYYINILNFSFLAVFWLQYTRNRFVFSEYLSNIISVYSLLITIEIFHQFSINNNLIFHFLGQYFTAILYALLFIILLMRFEYLLSPQANRNEFYIKNYNMLYGFMDKPYKGVFFEIYHNINHTLLTVFLISMLVMGVILFIYNKFNLFININILILIIGILISIILSIIHWQKHWYETMGFFFRRHQK
jgi:hypothetical protein